MKKPEAPVWSGRTEDGTIHPDDARQLNFFESEGIRKCITENRNGLLTTLAEKIDRRLKDTLTVEEAIQNFRDLQQIRTSGVFSVAMKEVLTFSVGIAETWTRSLILEEIYREIGYQGGRRLTPEEDREVTALLRVKYTQEWL
jgi:hypothetical protein